jgi:hypothetical protein
MPQAPYAKRASGPAGDAGSRQARGDCRQRHVRNSDARRLAALLGITFEVARLADILSTRETAVNYQCCRPTPDPSAGSYRGPSPASFFLISGLSYKTTFNSELRISSFPLYSI